MLNMDVTQDPEQASDNDDDDGEATAKRASPTPLQKTHTNLFRCLTVTDEPTVLTLLYNCINSTLETDNGTYAVSPYVKKGSVLHNRMVENRDGWRYVSRTDATYWQKVEDSIRRNVQAEAYTDQQLKAGITLKQFLEKPDVVLTFLAQPPREVVMLIGVMRDRFASLGFEEFATIEPPESNKDDKQEDNTQSKRSPCTKCGQNLFSIAAPSRHIVCPPCVARACRKYALNPISVLRKKKPVSGGVAKPTAKNPARTNLRSAGVE